MNSQLSALKPPSLAGGGGALRPASSQLLEPSPVSGIGASLRQKLLPGGPSASMASGLLGAGSAGAVLDHLKRHAGAHAF